MEQERATRPCRLCGHTKILDDFDRAADKPPLFRRSECKDCRRELSKGRNRVWKRNSPEVERRNQARRYFGITLEEYDRHMTPGTPCGICGDVPEKSKHRHLDHDHVTGKIRGMLCNKCNVGIGYMRDDPALLRAAADYIERHKEPTGELSPAGPLQANDLVPVVDTVSSA